MQVVQYARNQVFEYSRKYIILAEGKNDELF